MDGFILAVLTLTLIFHLFGKGTVFAIAGLVGVTYGAIWLISWWRDKRW